MYEFTVGQTARMNQLYYLYRGTPAPLAVPSLPPVRVPTALPTPTTPPVVSFAPSFEPSEAPSETVVTKCLGGWKNGC